MARAGGAVFVVLLFAGAVLAETLRVPADHAMVQSAIDAASEGDTIIVAPGDYVITRPLSFRGKAITLRSEEGADATTIRMGEVPDDPERASVVIFEEGEEPTAFLEGFTLTGGKGSVMPTPKFGFPWTIGGGILCVNGSSPTVKSCRIIRNGVLSGPGSWVGGGIAAVASSPTITSCAIEKNCAHGGAGIACADESRPLVSECSIQGNFAEHGGGVAIGGDSVMLEKCTILGNWAYQGYGGGVFCGRGVGRLLNCLIAGNFAEWEGGVFSDGSLEVINCTIVDNRSRQQGPGIYCDWEGASVTVLNSIVWGNYWGPLCGDFSYSLTDQDPLFVRPGAFDFERFVAENLGGRTCMRPDFIVDPGDYRLEAGSLALDAGRVDAAPRADIEGTGRPCGSGLDIGAYERGGCTPSPEVLFRRGDGNVDGALGLADAVFVLNFLFLGGSAPECKEAADSDDSGSVSLSDAVLLLNYLFLGGRRLPEPLDDCGTDMTPDGLWCAAYGTCGI